MVHLVIYISLRVFCIFFCINPFKSDLVFSEMPLIADAKRYGLLAHHLQRCKSSAFKDTLEVSRMYIYVRCSTTPQICLSMTKPSVVLRRVTLNQFALTSLQCSSSASISNFSVEPRSISDAWISMLFITYAFYSLPLLTQNDEDIYIYIYSIYPNRNSPKLIETQRIYDHCVSLPPLNWHIRMMGFSVWITTDTSPSNALVSLRGRKRYACFMWKWWVCAICIYTLVLKHTLHIYIYIYYVE